MTTSGLLPRMGQPIRCWALLLGAWAGAWFVYYALQELKRGLVLARRRRRHPLVARPADVPDSAWWGHADKREREHIVARFSPIRFGGRYLNVTPEWREQGAWEWLWWKVVHSTLWGSGGGFSDDVKRPGGAAYIERVLPVEPLDVERLWGSDPHEPVAVRAQGVSYAWLGQSTCLVQLHGVTILTDPVFGDRPLESVLSPRRMRPMPCTLEQVRHVDVVLVSHNHYDHLDLSVARALPPSVQWIVPTGVGRLLTSQGVLRERIVELGWWDEWYQPWEVRVAQAKKAPRRLDVAAVPASHWSGRTLLDTNQSLWNSYVVRCGAPGQRSVSLFFCGDSGYSPSLFASVGRMYGPFDLAAIPIGSYEPRWHLSLQHMDPRGAVRVARDIGARQGVAMHWGTWCMSGAYASG